MGLDAELGGHLGVPMRHAVGVARAAVVGFVGEDVGGRIGVSAGFLVARLVLLEQRGRGVVQGDPVHLVSLGVLDDQLAFPANDAALDGERAGVDVEVFPVQGDEFAASGTGTKVSQTNIPQSSSCSQPAATIRAASSDDGGLGRGGNARGRTAAAAGLMPIHPQRTAAPSAPLSTASTCRTVDAASGLHLCCTQRW